MEGVSSSLGRTGWSQHPPGRSARLNGAPEAAHPSQAARTFGAASSGRIPGCPQAGLSAVSLRSGGASCHREAGDERRTGQSCLQRGGGGKRLAASQRMRLQKRSVPRAAAPRRVPSLLEWLSHSGTHPQSPALSPTGTRRSDRRAGVRIPLLRLLEMPLPQLKCKRDHTAVTIIWVLFDSKYGGRETERNRK